MLMQIFGGQVKSIMVFFESGLLQWRLKKDFRDESERTLVSSRSFAHRTLGAVSILGKN